jgi:RHS repeat-associated protein
MEFEYDAFGRRVLKIEKPTSTGGTPSAQDQWVYTYYVNDADGNVMAMYTLAKGTTNHDFKLENQHIQGNKRLGLLNRAAKLLARKVVSSGTLTQYAEDACIHTAGTRQYEYSNHLQNVLLVTSDRKIPYYSGSVYDHFEPQIVSYQDYFPFGSNMPDRGSNAYIYGFNGMLKDDNLKGNGNSYDFGARIYDSRLGRWLSRDPHELRYSSMSTYNFAYNSPIAFNDLNGKDGTLTIDYAANTITLKTTVNIYGAQNTQIGEDFAKFANAEFDKLTNSYQVKDKSDPTKIWTVKIDVEFVYNDCIDSYNENMGTDAGAPMNGNEGEIFTNLGLILPGENVYNMAGVPNTRDLGIATQGGNEAQGGANFSIMMHEVFHELGYDERYLGGVPITYYETDFLSCVIGSEIHPIHFIDLTDYATDYYCESGTYLLGNKEPTEYSIPIENIDGSIKMLEIIIPNLFQIDDTGGGRKIDIKGDENKVKSRAQF